MGTAWFEVKLGENDIFEMSKISIKSYRTHAIRVQHSFDHGLTYHDVEDGKQFPTGQTEEDDYELERQIEIPTVRGNAFRILNDKEHRSGANFNARFDFWVRPISKQVYMDHVEKKYHKVIQECKERKIRISQIVDISHKC